MLEFQNSLSDLLYILIWKHSLSFGLSKFLNIEFELLKCQLLHVLACQFNEVTIEEEDISSLVKCPVTTRLVLETDKDTKEPVIEVDEKLICKLKPRQVEGAYSQHFYVLSCICDCLPLNYWLGDRRASALLRTCSGVHRFYFRDAANLAVTSENEDILAKTGCVCLFTSICECIRK